MLIMWIQQYLLEKKNNCFLKQLGFMIHCLADYCSKAHTVLTQEKPKRIHEHQLMHKTELRIHADQTRKKYKNNQTYQISLFYKRNPVSVANRFLHCCFSERITVGVVLVLKWNLVVFLRFFFQGYDITIYFHVPQLLPFQFTLFFL